MKVRIITNRLPQPDRRAGAVIDVSPEKAASMIAQGFAEAVEAQPEADKPKRGRPRKEAAL
jgi:hypothetical protein